MEYKEDFDINFSAKDKVCAITGAASGIGYAIALMFAKKGANVFMVDLSEEVCAKAKELSDLYGIKAHGVKADISEKGISKKLADECINVFGKVNILVNNAGISSLEDAENHKEEDWDRVLNVNLKAPFMLSQSFANKMIEAKNGGKIINIASQASVIALDKHISYCASKAGLVSVTKVCALEWAEFGINVNSISPTVILTEMGRNFWKGEKGENMKKLIPAKRFGYPEEVAACCIFLASDAASLITGENMIIDGGYTIQ